ncbi:MAG: hypothetical protein KBT06_05555 [Prevotellaceae bacterium]|nr:hypothetical protein [Candidatus Colivivens equi]
MGVITYNGKSSSDFGIIVEHYPSYDIPEKDYDVVHVPGRNGDILIDKGSYQNVNRTYDLAVGSYEDDTYISLVRNLISWLCSSKGYTRLSDSYEPDCYRMAVYKDANTIENILNKAGRASITFDCKPQRFLLTGDVPVTFTAAGTISNPTLFDSKPIITITGSGYGTLIIGDASNPNNVCKVTLLDYSIADSVGIVRVRIDGEQFMAEVGDDPEDSYEFICTGNRCSGTVTSTSENPITIDDMGTEENTAKFIEKVGTNALETYNFIFTPELKGAAIYDSSSLNNIDTSEAELPSENEVEELWYCTRISSVITGYSGLQTGDVLFTNIDRFSDSARQYLENETSLGAITCTFKYNSTDEAWLFYPGGIAVNLSDFGLELAEGLTLDNNDSFDVTVTSYWKTDNMSEGEVNYPKGIKCNGLANFNDSILVFFYPEYWTLSGFKVQPSDYGINITGQAIEGDSISVKVNAIWELEETEVNIGDYGIVEYGTPEVNDTIEVLTSGSVTIDSEQKDCYSGEKNKNYDVEFQNGFPEIPSGEVAISFTGGIEEVEVVPKWWTI